MVRECSFHCVYTSNSINYDLCCISGDVPRVNGQLAVSRAFGDKSLKSHLRSDPDVQNTDIDDNTDILILASDGLWKVNDFICNPNICCFGDLLHFQKLFFFFFLFAHGKLGNA